MISAIAIVLIALPLYWVYSIYASLQRNIKAAKLTGLPVVVTRSHSHSVNIYNTLWLLTHRLIIPILHKLPTTWTEEYIDLLQPDWPWQIGYDPFAKHGDTFITANPTGISIWTAEPEAIYQITQRREAFPKPLESYKVLDVYGKNVVSSEGGEWKMHRKVASPGFNEKNNALVFQESVAQTQSMLRKWLGPDGTARQTLTEVPMDSMRVTLHIISKIGFGVGLLWPGEEPNEKENNASLKYSSHEALEGFTMSFEQALSVLLVTLVWILLLPRWLLKYVPLKGAKAALESYENWGKYMKAIYDQKVAEARSGEHSEGMDIMGSLVRSTMVNQSDKVMNSAGSNGKNQGGQSTLSQSDILGNAFVIIIAGHETTANSLHFALMMLAMTPGSQRNLQKEVESIFGSTPPEDWNYESCINKCLGGMIGAVLNEELRLMPPVISIPKSVKKEEDQQIVLNGTKHVLTKGAFINLTACSVHRNPKYWPSRGPSKISGLPNDLDDFIPERWLLREGTKGVIETADQREPAEEDFGGFTGETSAAELFRPVRGAFIPFSDGPRSCLGRRLAQVEVVAVLSVIFQKYSVELAVDRWATDEEVAKMSRQEKVELYKKAQKNAAEIIKSATTRITLKLHDGETFIPIRVVPKGQERFLGLFE